MSSRARAGPHGGLTAQPVPRFAKICNPVMKPLDMVGLGDWRAWVTAAARGRVLEIGVGTGLNLAHYSSEARIVAFDPDAGMLAEILDDDYPTRLTLLRARAERLPFPGDCFDAVVGTLVLCTIPDTRRALAEVRRVLKPGAPLRLVEHVRARNPIAGRLMDAATPLWKQVAGGCHLNRDTLREVRRAGFEITGLHKKWFGLMIGIEARK